MPLLIRGRIDINETQSKLIADDIERLENVKTEHLSQKPTGKLYLKFSLGKDFLIPYVKEYAKGFKGSNPIYLYIEETKQKFVADHNYYVNPSVELMTELKKILGDDCVVYKESK